MAGPVFSGAVQLTCTLSAAIPLTVGASGVSGGSSTSVTVIVTGTVALWPLGVCAVTVTS